jgi:DNA topoisomerase VI subunit B
VLAHLLKVKIMSTSSATRQVSSIADFARLSQDLVTALRTSAVRLATYIGQSTEERELKHQEAYLAQATDRYDLEYRIRELDRTRHAR